MINLKENIQYEDIKIPLLWFSNFSGDQESWHKLIKIVPELERQDEELVTMFEEIQEILEDANLKVTDFSYIYDELIDDQKDLLQYIDENINKDFTEHINENIIDIHNVMVAFTVYYPQEGYDIVVISEKTNL